MGLWDRPRGRKRHRDGVLGGGADVALGGVGDDHALFGRGIDVDVVDADARAPDDHQLGCRPEERGRDVGPRADDQSVGVGDGRVQLLARRLVGHGNVVAPLAEPIEPRLVDGIGDEYLHSVEFSGPEITLALSPDVAWIVHRVAPGVHSPRLVLVRRAYS